MSSVDRYPRHPNDVQAPPSLPPIVSVDPKLRTTITFYTNTQESDILAEAIAQRLLRTDDPQQRAALRGLVLHLRGRTDFSPETHPIHRSDSSRSTGRSDPRPLPLDGGQVLSILKESATHPDTSDAALRATELHRELSYDEAYAVLDRQHALLTPRDLPGRTVVAPPQE